MAMTRRERLRGATMAEIKQIATRQMAEEGTAAISLRAIAREMGMSAPALYRYFASRDDLITALILDAYTSMADALESVVSRHTGESIGDRLLAALLAYREWALAHPIDYQLILGNPIPRYSAPSEVTTQAARRTLGIFARLVGEAYLQGEPAADSVPRSPDPQGAIEGQPQTGGPSAPVDLLENVVAGWAQTHGLITLELFGHLQPLVGDPGALYRMEAEAMVRRLGLALGEAARGQGEAGAGR
jgi:AcrR family transcriptional regulator